MPTYRYACPDCGFEFEKQQKFTDDPIKKCPNCGKKHVYRMVSKVAVSFKGSGWYITDSKSDKDKHSVEIKHDDKDKSDTTDNKDTADTKTETTDKADKTETKIEPKTETTKTEPPIEPAIEPAARARRSTKAKTNRTQNFHRTGHK